LNDRDFFMGAFPEKFAHKKSRAMRSFLQYPY
jgi:hypothetical protein